MTTPYPKLVKAPPDVELGEFKAVVVAAVLLFRANSLRPTAVSINSLVTSLPLSKIEKILTSDEFASEMYRNGVSWNTYWDALSTRQMQCLLEIANPLSGRTLQSRLKAAGVSAKEYATWKKNPLFQARLVQLTEDLLVNSKPEIQASLLNLALDGKLEAIKYIDELTGSSPSSLSNSQAINSSLSQTELRIADMRSFVQTVLEIVQSEVTDPNTLSRIASRVQLALSAVTELPLSSDRSIQRNTREQLLEALK
jgi:hypothetical protein